MFKKALFLSSTAIASALSIATVISCTQEKYSSNDIGGLNNEFNPGETINNELVKAANKIRREGTEKQKEALNQKTILLTTGGEVRDISFNQSVWEAVSKFSKEIGNPNNSYYETKSITDEAQGNAYDYALAKGFKIWILTGFQQGALLKTWLKVGRNQERFANAKVRVITVDWFADEEMEKLTPPGSIMGLNFETQQAAFVASYAAAKLLKEINDENNELYKNPTFDTFGGGDFSGVTNFNYGFIEGIRQFNEDLRADAQSTIKNFVLPSTSTIELGTSFALTIESKAKVEVQVDTNKPQVVFPVAGPLTANAIDFIKAKKSGQWVIGVDTNQSLAFPNDKGMLLTSVEKRISIAVYKALAIVYGVANFDPQKMKDFLPKGYSFNIDTGYLQYKKDSNSKTINKNCDVKKGYDASFVGVSKSTLNDDLKFKSGETYAQKFDKIAQQTWDDFFGKAGNDGRLAIDLKPSQQVIDNFAKAISTKVDNKTSNEELEKLSKDILALKNVKYGYMTANNKLTYFDPQMSKIIKDYGNK